MIKDNENLYQQKNYYSKNKIQELQNKSFESKLEEKRKKHQISVLE